jgi:hypothetical protein
MRITYLLEILFLALFLSSLPAAGQIDQAGMIIVHSVPDGATVTIDGTSVGTTPLNDYPILYGAHNVTVSYPEYNDYSVEINVGPDSGTYILTPVLTTNKASYLAITTFPSGAAVYLDGSHIGTTPDIGFQFMSYGNNFLLVNGIPYGNHTVKTSLPGYPDLTANVSLIAPKGAMIYLNFGEAASKDDHGSLGLVSNPEGANVYLDSIYLGKTPLYLVNNVTVGEHEVLIIHDGYREFGTNLTVKPGGISSVTAFLTNNTPQSMSPSNGKASIPFMVVLGAMIVSFYCFTTRKKK